MYMEYFVHSSFQTSYIYKQMLTCISIFKNAIKSEIKKQQRKKLK